MFPDARNSLRQWSELAETKIPIPVAITLHNFIPPSMYVTTKPSFPTTENSIGDREIRNSYSNESEESFSSSPSKEEDAARRDRGMWLNRQPQHNNNLLPRVNLEITVTRQERKGEEQKDYNGELYLADSKPTVVYADQSPRTRSVHPSWEHLDERIRIDEFSEWWNQNELYKSMKAKLWVAAEVSQDVEEEQLQSSEDGCLIEAHLHPSFLERIDLGSTNANNADDIDSSSLLPPALPPNAMLVHFSDGSVRCPPYIYQVLWQKFGHSHGILEPPPVEDFSRFEDDVFATLDHVKQTPLRPRGRSISSLLDQDHESTSQIDHDEKNSKDNGLQKNLFGEEDKQKSSRYHQPEQTLVPATPQRPSTVDKQQHQHNNDIRFRLCESDIIEEERRQEKLDVLRLIAEEERGLEEDLYNLETEQRALTKFMEDIEGVERDISRVKAELKKQSLMLEREEFLKEAQSIKLFRDLRDVYPIALGSAAATGVIATVTSTSEEKEIYLIRGLRLPGDIYTTAVPEEEVNTALGYCAHLVFMAAKYQMIQLRHRIFCNGSRSAIELDGVGIFPLFMGRLAARALEREQVDRGARLLGANVDCIMMHLNLMPSSSSSPASLVQEIHILERLRSILDFVAEGKRTI